MGIKICGNNNNSPILKVGKGKNSKQTTSYPKEKQDEKKPKFSEEEKKAVKKWKNKALNTFIFSAIISFVVIIMILTNFKIKIYENNYSFDETSDLFKVFISAASLIWSAFVFKIYYDRIFDPSKEKGFIDLMRMKKP